MIASKSPCAASSCLTKSGEQPSVLIEDIKPRCCGAFLLAELLAQLGAGHFPPNVIIQLLAQLQQAALTGRCGDATECAEGGLGNRQGTVATKLCQLFADQHAIAALQNPNSGNNHWIAKITQHLLAELQKDFQCLPGTYSGLNYLWRLKNPDFWGDFFLCSKDGNKY